MPPTTPPPSSAVDLSRRAVTAGLAGLAAGVACKPEGDGRAAAGGVEEAASKKTASGTAGRLPAVYLPHGGGPWPFVDLGMPKEEFDGLAGYLRGLPARLPAHRAVLAISAHWEAKVPTVSTHPAPPLLFDYYGFPPASYQLTWPAPGDPALAARVRALLEGAGIATAEDAARGFDHGTFVPLKLAYPTPTLPVVQLSLKAGLDPREHLAIGAALAPLRDEGVLLVGSGMSFHNMRAFRFHGGGGPPIGAAFDAWLHETATLDAPSRDARLARWAEAPGGREAHPREEHLLPLHVIAGAAGADRGTIAYAGTVLGARVTAIHFG